MTAYNHCTDANVLPAAHQRAIRFPRAGLRSDTVSCPARRTTASTSNTVGVRTAQVTKDKALTMQHRDSAFEGSDVHRIL